MRRLDTTFDPRQSLLDCLDMLLHAEDPFSKRFAAEHPGASAEEVRDRLVQSQRRPCSFLDAPLGIQRSSGMARE